MNCQNVRTIIDTKARREPLHETVKFHLGGCGDCRSYADETSALLALLNAQPRVEAPADFNFKLRARMARAQAEPRGPVAVLENVWAKTFSWGQAAMATATLAIVAALSAYYFIDNRQATPDRQFVAEHKPVAPPTLPQTSAVPDVTTARQATAEPAPVRYQSARATVKAARTNAPMLVAAAAPVRTVSTAPTNDTTRFYSREQGRVMTASSKGYVYGAEDASLSKPAVFVASF